MVAHARASRSAIYWLEISFSHFWSAKTIAYPDRVATTPSLRQPWVLDAGRSKGEMGYLPGLDGIRAIAVIGVLLYHAGWSALPGGFLGVDVFFVLSGFLITTLILEEMDRSGRVNFKRFYLGRARRLLPAVVLMLLVVGAVVIIWAQDAAQQFGTDAIASIFYVNNWWYIVADQSYFESIGRPPLLKHLWSLAVEEQFYLVWPALAFFIVRRSSRRTLRWVALGLAAASTTWMAVLSSTNGYPEFADPSRAYFGTDAHAMGLLIGAALATAWRPGRLPTSLSAASRRLLMTIGVLALLAVLGFFVFVGEFTPWLYRGGFLVLAVVVAVLIAMATHPALPLGAWLGNAPMRYIGRRSYGLYLWHWPVMMLTRSGIDTSLTGPALLTVQLATTFALAELSYRFVEMPIRQGVLGKWWKQWRSGAWNARQRTAALTAVSTFVIFTLAVIVGLAFSARDVAASGPAVDVAAAIGIADGGPLEVSIDPADSINAQATEPTETAKEPMSDEPSLTEQRALNGPVSALGDSVMLGARNAITEAIPGTGVDASVSRMPGAFTGRVKKLTARGLLANVVVIHPGTNGVLPEEILRNILDPLVDYERVVLVNAAVPRTWERPNNKVMESVAADYPNVVIADWNEKASGNRDFFVSDGVHLSKKGALAYAQLINEVAAISPVS